MRNRLIVGVEQANCRKTPLHFDIGDMVTVKVRISEGGKERIQPFIGTVIARRGAGVNETFMVRRIVNNEGVERIFPVHSPMVVDVDVMRSGKRRRAKLFYLRDRVGKARKLRERRVSAEGAESSETPPAEPTESSGRALVGASA